MKIRHLAVFGLACVLFAAPCMQIQARAQPAGKAAPPAVTYFDASLNGSDAATVYAKLSERQQRGALSFNDTLDLAMSLYLQQRWGQAAGVYQSAVSVAKTPGEKAAALLGAAQSLANAQRWRDAAVLANAASRLVPNSKEAAAARYAFWNKAGDDLEATIAEDRMKQLNLNADGKVVFDPLTIVAIVCVTGVVVTWITETKPGTEAMKQVLPVMAAALIAIIKTTAGLQSEPASE